MRDFETRLASVLGRVIPEFEGFGKAKRLSGGASQETYRLEIETTRGPRVLALRRASGGVLSEGRGPGLEVEAELFRIARAAGVPEPEILYVLTEKDGLGPGFLMEWLEGETVGVRILKSAALEEVRPRLAFECGEVLARIHQIDPEAAGLSAKLKTVSPEAFVHEIWEHYRSFGTSLPMIDYTARWLLDHLPAPTAPRLVHNDFRNGNLMVSPEGIVAVLDWELAHLGDPIRDLGWICTSSWRFGRSDLPVGGFGRLEDLLDGYESVSGRRVSADHVRFWEVFGSFWWSAMSLMMAFGWRNGIDRTVERPAIARRSSECQVDCVNLILPGPVSLVEETAATSSVDMPHVEELLVSVRDFLRQDVREALEGRNAFLALVASNSLDIVKRELSLGPAHLQAEQERLQQLFASEERLGVLRERLCEGLREGTIPLDREGLGNHLRHTAVNQLAIDQPTYSGLATALSGLATSLSGPGDDHPSYSRPHEESR